MNLRVAVGYNPLGCKSNLPSPTLFNYFHFGNNSMRKKLRLILANTANLALAMFFTFAIGGGAYAVLSVISGTFVFYDWHILVRLLFVPMGFFALGVFIILISESWLKESDL
jgi:TRAP-type C4-dicarboxylate transport system permease small subunit